MAEIGIDRLGLTTKDGVENVLTGLNTIAGMGNLNSTTFDKTIRHIGDDIIEQSHEGSCIMNENSRQNLKRSKIERHVLLSKTLDHEIGHADYI